MSGYTLSATLPQPFAATLNAVRAGLTEQGFGVLTEIDLAATLHAKIGVTVPPQVILGACRPQLAHQALQADPSVATMLPCNVVVRAVDDATTTVEAFDPRAMVEFANTAEDTDTTALTEVAADARARLTALLDQLV